MECIPWQILKPCCRNKCGDNVKWLLVSALFAALLLAGCASNGGAPAPVKPPENQSQPSAEPPGANSTAIPNPASKFCADKGYELELRGSEGICKFPNGRECGEWQFYRGQCTDADSFEIAQHEEAYMINQASLYYKFYSDGRLMITKTVANEENESRLIAWATPEDFALFARQVEEKGFEGMERIFAQCESGAGCPHDAASIVFTLAKQGKQTVVSGYAYAPKPPALEGIESSLKAIIENSTFVDATESGCRLMKEGRADIYQCFGCPKGITNPICTEPESPILYDVNDSSIGSCTISAQGACEYLPPREMTRGLCFAWGGRWNDCGSACRGAPEGTACTLQCEQYCECGGAEGYACPDGYFCTDRIEGVGVCKPLA